MYSYPFDDIIALCTRYGYFTEATSIQLEKLLAYTLRDTVKLRDIAVFVWCCSGPGVRLEDVIHCFMRYFHPVRSE